MSKLATADRFEGGVGAWYSQYRRYAYFVEHADLLAAKLPNVGQGRVLVAGCGFGYLVDELVALGINAWGFDASSYAINQGKLLLPAIANRLMVADATVRAQMNAVRTAAGLANNQRFVLTITEDLFSACDSDAEVSLMLTELRRISTGMYHIITCTHPHSGDIDPTDTAWRASDCLWKSAPQWKTLIGQNETVMDKETGVEY